ncbi:MAG: hypothetical protein DRN05_01915, partial [Thermoplasmata archaeon]
TYPHAGEKGIPQRNPRKRGLRKRGRGTWKSDKPPVVTMVKKGGKQEQGEIQGYEESTEYEGETL